MKNQTKAVYYIFILTAVYLLIHDLCAAYIASFSGAGNELMFLFDAVEAPGTPFILEGAFGYIAAFLRINAVVVIFYGWDEPKPKAQLSVLIALFALQAALEIFAFIPPLLTIILYMVSQALSAAIAIMVLKMSREKEKPILLAVAVCMLITLALFALILTGVTGAMDSNYIVLIMYMVLGILTVLYSAGKLIEARPAKTKQ